MKIFRDDLPAATLRAHAILASAYPAHPITMGVWHTEVSESAEDLAALEVLISLGAVEHFDGTTFELTAAGDLYRTLVLLNV